MVEDANDCCESVNRDDCGICFGNNYAMDCAGVCFGTAVEDCAGICDGSYVICECPSDGSNCDLPENCPQKQELGDGITDHCCPSEPDFGCGCGMGQPTQCPDGTEACANLGETCCIDCGPICSECGAGTFDNCEESECNSTYCDFVNNTYPWPNSCTPKHPMDSECCGIAT